MTSDFTVVLRGYDKEQVDRLLAQADAALASSDEAVCASTRKLLQRPELVVVLRGYARDEVDDAVRGRLDRLGSTTDLDTPPRGPVSSSFTVVVRGYDMAQVDDAFGQVEAATQSDDAFVRASARDALRAISFRVRFVATPAPRLTAPCRKQCSGSRSCAPGAAHGASALAQLVKESQPHLVGSVKTHTKPVPATDQPSWPPCVTARSASTGPAGKPPRIARATRRANRPPPRPHHRCRQRQPQNAMTLAIPEA